MPTLLSPRGSITKMPEEEPVKKPKGVMGRIKSTFKLGRRKSSSSSSSASAAAAATAAFVSDDKEDAANDEPESKQDNDTDSVEDKSSGDETPVNMETDIKHFNAIDDGEEEEPAAPAAAAAKSEQRVATFELPAKSVHEILKADDEDPDEQEDEEVFACDYKPGEGPQHIETKKPELDDDDELEVFAPDNEGGSGNGNGGENNNDTPPAPAAKLSTTVQAKDHGAPHESDLMVVGVSPAKFRAMSGPSLSPVKRSQPPLVAKQGTDDIQESSSASGPTRSDAEPSLGDRIASAHSTRPTRQASVPSSPARRAQLLSDFQFGTEALAGTTATSSPVPSSPMKRRGNASPQPRRSFHRDHEQQLSINATGASASPAASPSPKRKPDTPSALPSTRAPRMERRNSLQGITEEEAKPVASPPEEAKLPPRPSAHAGRRRSAASMEAPILASSFVASAAPEIHDETATTEDANESPVTGDQQQESEKAQEAEETGASAFAFDAGAAITHEFGERIARLLGADPWGDRQDGFDAIVYQVKKTDLANAKNKRELFCAAVAAVQCGVDDRVAPVMYCALECLKGVLKEYVPVFDRSFLKYQPMNEQLSGLAKAVVGKLGDSNKRTQREASQAVLRLAKLKKLHVLPHVLLHLSAKEVSPRQRVETLRMLVKELGVDSKTAMNVEVVMQFAVPVLKIADEKTRKAAVELIAELHMINGQAVNAQLVGVKPEMLRVINRRVDELLAKKEEERQQQQQQAVQNANQAEEAANDSESAMQLVAVPVEDSKPVQALLETMLQQAQNVVGPVAWRKLESKTWSDRKEALVDLDKTITEAKSDLRDVKPAFNSVVQHNFLAYCTVVYKCLSDSIAPVVNSAMDGFSTLIKVYGPCVEWREEAVRDMILLTIMRLFGTMQKPNNRTNRAACRCILKLTRLTNPHTLRYALSCVFAKETDALVQMHLLRLLVPEFGFQSDGISASQVLDVVATALNHSNDKVRKTAIDVALCTQRLVGKDFILKKLTDVVKPVTLKELEKNFVDVDIQKDGERPQTVHATAVPTGATVTSGGALPPVQFGGSGGEHSRRQLNSAPVGLGKLHCTPPTEDDRESDAFASSYRRPTVLSNEEENLMDSILGSDDF